MYVRIIHQRHKMVEDFWEKVLPRKILRNWKGFTKKNRKPQGIFLVFHEIATPNQLTNMCTSKYQTHKSFFSFPAPDIKGFSPYLWNNNLHLTPTVLFPGSETSYP